MCPLLQQHQTELIELCRRYNVTRMEVFGSAADARFNEQRSDLDFLVEFGNVPLNQRFDNFFELQRSLAELFGRPIDLIEPGGMKNPYFIRRVNESRKLIYGA